MRFLRRVDGMSVAPGTEGCRAGLEVLLALLRRFGPEGGAQSIRHTISLSLSRTSVRYISTRRRVLRARGARISSVPFLRRSRNHLPFGLVSPDRHLYVSPIFYSVLRVAGNHFLDARYLVSLSRSCEVGGGWGWSWSGFEGCAVDAGPVALAIF